MSKRDNYLNRKNRVRGKVFGNEERPRLSVFRSNTRITAQIIDDIKGKTLVFAGDKDIKGGKTKTEKAALIGEALAKKALVKKVKKVVFDKGGYKYHGRVKALADGARKGGLDF
jgi:large subunit ribosomal protein L18